ncbi:hypothetical protein GGX14DRAFT_420202 [Mycena pura]|uniref:Uncharacterized protein n=1 Tax=Mycena pura TaxID=153505 RepID=A0AAD6YNZ0_9AGAR|nr:hypothetical protein GGX14DRAFT_420202 [Mycena pura]
MSQRLLPPGSDLNNVPYVKLLGTWHVYVPSCGCARSPTSYTASRALSHCGAIKRMSGSLILPLLVNLRQLSTTSFHTKCNLPSPGAPHRLRPMSVARRGKGLLMIATSRWQLLGFNIHTSADSDEPEWVVTYFASTLFTPAGLDIYSRSKDGLSDQFIEGLVEEIGALDAVAHLVKDGGMFRISHD